MKRLEATYLVYSDNAWSDYVSHVWKFVKLQNKNSSDFLKKSKRPNYKNFNFTILNFVSFVKRMIEENLI